MGTNPKQTSIHHMNISSTPRREAKKRIEELDFLKALFILLMIAFHLVYIGDGYPYLKQFVYTFHMPGFLIISGYLMKTDRSARSYGRTLLWLAVPYVTMEAGYVLMASLLPTRDHVDDLTWGVLFHHLFVKPLGPYWYLHTLMVCGGCCFAVFKWVKASATSRLIILGLAYAALAQLGLVSLACAMYFLAGVAIRQSPHSLLEVFRRSWWSLFALAVLFFHPAAFDRATVGGVLIVYLVFSASLSVYSHVPAALRRPLLFLGRNSLALYLFSPIFTICCKALVPYLAFDPTRLLFLCTSLSVCIVGSLGLCRLLDFLHISPLMFGRKRIVG